MAERRVTRTRKDDDGDITALCNPGNSWSPCKKQRAIRDIELGLHSYYVRVGGAKVDIHVAQGEDGKYLRTDPDETDSNNLDDLPDC